MTRICRGLVVVTSLSLAAMGCSSGGDGGGEAKGAVKTPARATFGSVFDVPRPAGAVGGGQAVNSVSVYNYSLGPAILGSVTTLEPDTHVDPAALAAGEVTVSEYAADHVLAVVRVEEILHGPDLPDGVGGTIRVALPGTLTVTLEEATQLAVEAGPVVWVVADSNYGTIGDGLYLSGGIYERSGTTFRTPFYEGVDDSLKTGMNISTFDQLVSAFRAL